MQLKDDPTIAGIRETRHRISEALGHDPQRMIEYYLQLQKQEEELRQQRKPGDDKLLETVEA